MFETWRRNEQESIHHCVYVCVYVCVCDTLAVANVERVGGAEGEGLG